MCILPYPTSQTATFSKNKTHLSFTPKKAVNNRLTKRLAKLVATCFWLNEQGVAAHKLGLCEL